MTDADAKAYYDAHPERYAVASRKVRYILVRSKRIADDVYRRLQRGADFSQLVRRFSIDYSSIPSGGRATMTTGVEQPSFDKVLLSLETNQISEPLKGRYGWAVIQPLGPVRGGGGLEQVRAAIQSKLLDEKRKRAIARWKEDLKSAYASKVTYAPGFAPSKDAAGG